LFSDPTLAIDVLADLHICLDKSSQKKKKKRKSISKKADSDEEEPEWIEVVVDLLLSLLSQNKHVLRQVVGSVMTVLSPHVNDNALQVNSIVIKSFFSF
jgi:DNA polymerase phi